MRLQEDETSGSYCLKVGRNKVFWVLGEEEIWSFGDIFPMTNGKFAKECNESLCLVLFLGAGGNVQLLSQR